MFIVLWVLLNSLGGFELLFEEKSDLRPRGLTTSQAFGSAIACRQRVWFFIFTNAQTCLVPHLCYWCSLCFGCCSILRLFCTVVLRKSQTSVLVGTDFAVIRECYRLPCIYFCCSICKIGFLVSWKTNADLPIHNELICFTWGSGLFMPHLLLLVCWFWPRFWCNNPYATTLVPFVLTGGVVCWCMFAPI